MAPRFRGAWKGKFVAVNLLIEESAHMANVEMATFETAVEKLCADWESDVSKRIGQAQQAVTKLTEGLTGKLSTLRVPLILTEKGNAPRLTPARINELLKQHSASLKGTVDLDLTIQIDVKDGKMSVNGYGIGGSFYR
jgi:hypothetical protein